MAGAILTADQVVPEGGKTGIIGYEFVFTTLKRNDTDFLYKNKQANKQKTKQKKKKRNSLHCT